MQTTARYLLAALAAAIPAVSQFALLAQGLGFLPENSVYASGALLPVAILLGAAYMFVALLIYAITRFLSFVGALSKLSLLAACVAGTGVLSFFLGYSSGSLMAAFTSMLFIALLCLPLFALAVWVWWRVAHVTEKQAS